MDQARFGELFDDLETLVADQPGLGAGRAALALAAAPSDRLKVALEQLASFWETGSLLLSGDFAWTAMVMVLARAAIMVGTPAMQSDLVAALSP